MDSQSDQLRFRQSRDGGGKSINTEEAKVHDVKVKDVMEQVLIDLRIKYPEKNFSLEKTLKQSMIAHRFNPSYQPSNPNSTIKPDGGILFLNDNIPLLSTEAKKQGTNQKRCDEGLKKQAMGNAIERAHKNYNEIKNLFDPYPYTGYILFGYGCDFQPGSSIIDRLSAMTYYDSFNTLHIKDAIKETSMNGIKLVERHKKASVFLQVLPFTYQFIYQQSMEAAEIALSYHQ
jgi:type II restriction enzyme